MPGGVDAEAVVDLPAPVEGEDYVRHLAVAELRDLVVEQHAVRRERKAEMLATLGLYAPRVGDRGA